VRQEGVAHGTAAGAEEARPFSPGQGMVQTQAPGQPLSPVY
jgi:hypothetical protein